VRKVTAGPLCKTAQRFTALNAKIGHPTGILHINYNYNYTQKNNQIQQDQSNTGNDQVTITYYSIGLHYHNLTLKRKLGAEKSHSGTFVQNYTMVCKPTPRHFTPGTSQKTPDLNITKQYLLFIGLAGQFTVKSEH
jgi:hypothetical protein